ncbi:MAG: TonB-dependent receptor [Parvibaculaceae bacterium]
MRRMTFVLSAGCFLGASAAALAEEIELGEILVTAGRTPAYSATVGRAHTIIDEARIERSQARTVADLLRQVPGVAVSRTGNLGGLTQIRVRGAEGNHVLVLIDGVEAGEVSQGEFDFGSLLASDIERIEVLRGPQSAFYGSNATAGVISIITKRGRRGGWNARFKSEGGTDATALISGLVSGGTERMDLALSAAFRRNDGYNISDFGDEKDGDRNATLNGRINIDLLENLLFDANVRYVDRRNEGDRQDFAFPDTPTQGLVIDSDDVSKARELLAGGGLTWILFDGAWTHRARGSMNDTSRHFFQDGAKSSASEGERVNASYQNTVKLEAPDLLGSVHSLTTGFEFEQESFRQRPPVFDPTQLDEKTRVLYGYVGEYKAEFLERFFLTGAARYDDNDCFRDAFTWSVSGAWLLPSAGTRLHSSVGTGVTNPTFFEQFGFIPAFFQGNPNLKPERSFGWDVGVEQKFFDGLLVGDVTYFNQDLEDEIQSIFAGGFTTPINLDGTSKRQGVEVSLTAYPLEGLTLYASYTYTDAKEPSGLIEVRRPKHAASVYAGYTFLDGRANVFADLVYNGRMDDLEFVNATPRTRVTLDEFVLLNVGGSYKLTEQAKLYARVENLLDQRYQEVFSYNAQGITGFLGARFTLGGLGS